MNHENIKNLFMEAYICASSKHLALFYFKCVLNIEKIAKKFGITVNSV